MNLMNVSYVISGLGLLLFALRFLTDSLDREIGRYLGSALQRVSKNSGSALFSGVFATSIVQASSVTVITTMGFLSRGLVTLDRALLIVLGAAIGSTLKGWYGAHLPLILGPILVFMGAIGLVAKTDQRRRRLWGVVIAVGITFLGLQLIETGLAPIAQTEIARNLLEISVDDGMISILRTVIFGFFLTVILQSSSSVLLLVISFSSQGLISIPAALGLMLGANVGTTTTSLIASVGQDNVEVKRLAVGYFLVKAFAVGLILTYFRIHTTLFEDSFQYFGWGKRPEVLIVAFHTWLNVMNALTWWLLLPLLVRTLVKLIPGKESSQGTSPFTLRVQRLLGSLPGRALTECLSKLQQVIRDLHWVSDSIFHVVNQRGNKEDHTAFLEEALRKCERTLDVLDSIRDVAWRYLKSNEHSEDSRKKVFGLVMLTCDLKNVEIILYSCIQTLLFDGICSISESHPILSKFHGIRENLNQSWEKVYSLELYHEKVNQLSLDSLAKNEADACLFEITVRLNAIQKMIENVGGMEIHVSSSKDSEKEIEAQIQRPREGTTIPYDLS